MVAAIRRRPVVAAVAGALTIAFSAILFRLAGVSPSTGAVLRCAFAVPPLLVLSVMEERRLGRRSPRARLVACVAGVFFGVDLVLWHHAIELVGAGLATVLGNVQVVIVGLLAWALLGERPAGRLLAATPLAFAGVVLISGVTGGGYGSDPGLGALLGVIAGISYSGFLLVLRHGDDDRRLAAPLLEATATAVVVAVVAGLAAHDLDLRPAWPAWGWLLLLALESQVVGWLLISVSLRLLPAALTSMLLTIQPLGSMVLAALIFGEAPSVAQLAGAAVILTGILLASTARRPPAVSPGVDAAAAAPASARGG